MVKLTAMWRILTSKHSFVLTQRHPGDNPALSGGGEGGIKDMFLMATAVKHSYDGFINMINEIATESGELQVLQELRNAVDVLEKTNGGQ